MRRIILLIALAIGMAAGNAETISQKQAQQMAGDFLSHAAGKTLAPPKLVYNGKKLTTDRLFTPFYVYNSTVGGFVIISADNKAYPILGYSLTDKFEPSDLGPAETALLTSYAREIELVRYDSNPVPQTESCWIHYEEYVDNLLKEHYIATDPLITPEEASIMIDEAEERDVANYSDIYSPVQWQEIILDQLAANQSVPLLILNKDKEYPAVVYGHKGDYFRVEMSRRNSWLMRLNATEVISAQMITTGYDEQLIAEAEEERPFATLDEYLEDVFNQEYNRTHTTMIDDMRVGSDEPRLMPLGSGRFQLNLPENVREAFIYNLGGSMVARQRFSGTTPDVLIDIMPESRGFYFLTAVGESGKTYGFKLHR